MMEGNERKMVIGMIGESCTGKSTLAEALAKKLNAKIYAGKDYLRMAKAEAEARKAFMELLKAHEGGGDVVVYVITDKEHLDLLPEKALRVLATADLETIKERFAERMNGMLPPPLATMLEKKHGMFDGERHDLRVESGKESVEAATERILQAARAKG